MMRSTKLVKNQDESLRVQNENRVIHDGFWLTVITSNAFFENPIRNYKKKKKNIKFYVRQSHKLSCLISNPNLIILIGCYY